MEIAREGPWVSGERFPVVWEEPHDAFPAVTHPDWSRSFPWIVQGTTTRTTGAAAFDLGFFSGASPEARITEHWEALRSHAGLSSIVHARQVHGSDVLVHASAPHGLTLTDSCDGHVSRIADMLLAVTVADCVPVFVVDPSKRVIGALHAGWRGAVAGILERGVGALGAEAGSRPNDLLVHLGPAICGSCYEVGPEVFTALGQTAPGGPAPIDLRRILAERAVAAGVSPESVSISGHCTRCTEVGFFSHRGGDRERQVGFLGVRP